jgi:predicted nucleic acid-binding protein
MAIYVDTSALAKRYIDEVDSGRFDAFLSEPPDVMTISPLVVTEFHSILMRRRRMGEFEAAYVEQARAAFSADLAANLWTWMTFPTAAFGEASLLIQDDALGLATLDALHLATARLLNCSGFATADRRLARAAAQRGLELHQFAD